eukprot:79165-Chlamydomonas_euryale.AAC.1
MAKKERILRTLQKLNDRDTQKSASEELLAIVRVRGQRDGRGLEVREGLQAIVQLVGSEGEVDMGGTERSARSHEQRLQRGAWPLRPMPQWNIWPNYKFAIAHMRAGEHACARMGA